MSHSTEMHRMAGSVATHFDLFVVGGGSGGIACARRAAAYGKTVAVAEYKRLGGTCVNVGCVPKKVMWSVANIQETLNHLYRFGFKPDPTPKLDYAAFKESRDSYVKRLNEIYFNNLSNSKVTYYNAWASLMPDGHTVRLNPPDGSEHKEVTAEHVLIASGGKPSRLGIPGEEHTIDSDKFFELEQLPSRVAVIGAGYIAVELAGILHALGSETHLFVRFDTALRRFDEMVKNSLDAEMKRSGIQVHPWSTPKKVSPQPDQKGPTKLLALELENGQIHPDFDCILVAVGRVPITDGMGLEEAKVRLKPHPKHIVVDEYQNTSAPGVYALGDVCGHVELTPMAIAAGRRLADRLFGGFQGAKADYTYVPTVVFSHPPLATCGFTEKDAEEQFGVDKLKVYTGTSFNLHYGSWKVAPEEKPKTHIKMICLKEEEEKVIGIHVFGMGADELIQGFGVAIKMGARKADFDNCVAVHPTAAEELVTLPPWGLSGRL